MTVAFIVVFGLFILGLGILVYFMVKWGHREDRRRNKDRGLDGGVAKNGTL
jgi:hypothetical protein